jgi:hypothetical protein
VLISSGNETNETVSAKHLQVPKQYHRAPHQHADKFSDFF